MYFAISMNLEITIRYGNLAITFDSNYQYGIFLITKRGRKFYKSLIIKDGIRWYSVLDKLSLTMSKGVDLKGRREIEEQFATRFYPISFSVNNGNVIRAVQPEFFLLFHNLR